MNDDLMRKAYQSRTQAPPGSGRPSADELARLVAGSGTDEERLDVLDRALAHADSAREFELLRAVATAEKGAAVKRAPRWRVPFAVAATAMFAVAAALLGPFRRGPDILRAPPAAGVPAPVSPDDAAIAAPGSILFVWHALSTAGGYRLELVTEAGVLVATKNTPDTTTSVGVERAGAYRWVVVALLPEGAEVLSRPRRLRITP